MDNNTTTQDELPQGNGVFEEIRRDLPLVLSPEVVAARRKRLSVVQTFQFFPPRTRVAQPRATVFRLPEEVSAMIFKSMQPEFPSPKDWIYEADNTDVRAFFKWTVVLGTCAEWREIGLSYLMLWPITYTYKNKVYGLFEWINEHELVPRFPGTPMMVHMDRTGPNDILLEVLLPNARSDQAIFVSVNDEATAHQLYSLAQQHKPNLRGLVTGHLINDVDVPTIEGHFPSLDSLSLHCWTTHRNLSCPNLYKLHIQDAEYREPAQLRELGELIRAMPNLGVLSFEGVKAHTTTLDTTERYRPADSKIKQITFDDTEGVSILLEYIGIPTGVRIFARNILWGTIFPQDDRKLGEFAGYDTADTLVTDGDLEVVICKGGSELIAVWSFDDDWMDTVTMLLDPVRVLDLSGEDDDDTGDVLACAANIETLRLRFCTEQGLLFALSALQMQPWVDDRFYLHNEELKVLELWPNLLWIGLSDAIFDVVVGRAEMGRHLEACHIKTLEDDGNENLKKVRGSCAEFLKGTFAYAAQLGALHDESAVQEEE